MIASHPQHLSLVRLSASLRGVVLATISLQVAAMLICCLSCPSAGLGAEWAKPATDALRVPEPGVPLGSRTENVAVPLIDAATQDAAHGPTPKTLDEFVSLALQNHPKLRSAQAAVEAARGKAVQAKLYPNPLAAAGSPQAVAPGSGAANGGQGASTQYYSIMSQDIITAGKLRLSQQAALREVQIAEYQLLRTRYDVLAEVRQSFYALLVSQRRVEIYQLLLDIAKRSYEIGRQLAEAGEGTKADVLFWSIERDRAEVRLLNASVFIETGRRQVATAIALPRADVGTIEGDLLRKLPNFDLKTLQEAVVQANARPRAAEADISRSQWALERAVVQPIPNVNLMGGYQREINYPPSNQGLFQVTVAVPIFDRNQGNIRSARADVATSRANLRSIEIDLATQTAQAIATYRTSQRLVEWYEQYILPKARETVQLTQSLYARGEVTFLSLLQAQKILTETELAFVEAQADRWTGAVTIASLLQLEQFPPEADAPAAIVTNDIDSELNPRPVVNPQAQQPANPAGNPPAGQAPARLPAGADAIQPLPVP